MKKMSSRLKGLSLGVAAIVVATAVIPMAIAAALPAGTPSAGSVTLSPLTGTSATTFSVIPPAGASCPGDNTQSYLYHTFITPLGNDPADMVYTPSGTPTGEPQFTNNLANSVGTRSRNLLPGLGDGLLIAVSNQSFANTALFGTLAPGTYTFGIACTQPDAAFVPQTMRYWSNQITIAASPGSGPNNLLTLGIVLRPPPRRRRRPPPRRRRLPPTTTTTTLPPTTTTTTLPPTTTTTTLPPTTTTTTTLPPTTTTTTLPPTTTTTTTLPPTTTTTTTTTTPPTTTTTTTPPTTTPPTTTPPTTTPPTTTTPPPTTTVPPRPEPTSPYDVTCSGGTLRRTTTGLLFTRRGPRWMPKIAVLFPTRGRALAGVIISKEVRDDEGDDDASYGSSSHHGSSNGKHSSRRTSTCVTAPYTNSSGGTSVIEFKIRFI